MKRCPNCGRETGDRSAYCPACGAALPPADDTQQQLERLLEEVQTGGSGHGFEVEFAGGVDAAGAAYEHFGIVFRVEVYQHRAGNHTFTQVVGTGEAGFFVDGE